MFRAWARLGRLERFDRMRRRFERMFLGCHAKCLRALQRTGELCTAAVDDCRLGHLALLVRSPTSSRKAAATASGMPAPAPALVSAQEFEALQAEHCRLLAARVLALFGAVADAIASAWPELSGHGAGGGADHDVLDAVALQAADRSRAHDARKGAARTAVKAAGSAAHRN